MARSSVSAQCDLVASYMDGVHVKIAEAYKPPRKVCLPAVYNNKLLDVSKLTYNFTLERSVLEKGVTKFSVIVLADGCTPSDRWRFVKRNCRKIDFDLEIQGQILLCLYRILLTKLVKGTMTEWRKVRQASNKARHTRLDEKRKKEKKACSPPPPPPLPDNVKQLPVNAPVPETTILTPQPLSLPANDLQDHVKTNGLDYADFDNDTSSPFDNMELKTINDMEELAQVLQPTFQWAPPAKLESILKDLTVNDQSDVHSDEKNDNIKNETSDQEEEPVTEIVNHRSVSAIVQDLQRDLERRLMEDWKPWPNLDSPNASSHEALKQDEPAVTNEETVMNLLLDLSEEDKKLARHLSDMGFPLSRAARAIRNLGGQDNKKIVEYLLAVQSLEEVGMSGEDAEKALALTEYNQDKAKAYYENLCTLQDLGFPEEEASAALLKYNIDRDRALDFLIA